LINPRSCPTGRCHCGGKIVIGLAMFAALGMVAGSFVYAVATRSFRWEGFRDAEDTANHLVGGVLTALAGPAATDIYAAHVDLVRHGRRVCHARRPACGTCPLNDLCPSAGSFS